MAFDGLGCIGMGKQRKKDEKFLEKVAVLEFNIPPL